MKPLLKSTRFPAILALVSGLTLTFFPAAPSSANGNCVTYFAGQGNGTPTSPYLVDSQLDLEEVDFCLSAHFLQTATIALTGTWIPLANSGTPFSGSYNGGGYSITGLNINAPSTMDIGLFSKVSGSITGVHVSGTVIGRDKTGGIVGLLDGGTITHSSSAVNVTGRDSTGGLVGAVRGSTGVTSISDSFATGTVTGSGLNVGGLIGDIHGGNVARSWATGNVTAAGQFQVGGLIGFLLGGDLEESFATGNVSGFSYLGSLVGRVESSSRKPTVTNTYAFGNVSSDSTGTNIGGLIGLVFRGTVNSSYSIGSATGDALIGGFAGELDGSAFGGLSGATINNSYSSGTVTGGSDPSVVGDFIGFERDTTEVNSSGHVTSLALKSASTFVGWSIGPYWNGGTTWAICSTYNSGYPYLVSTVPANPSGCALTPSPEPTPEPTPNPTPSPTTTPLPVTTTTQTQEVAITPTFQAEVRPLAPGVSAVTGDVVAVTPPIRSDAPAGTTPKNAPRVSAKVGQIIRVSINGLAASSDVVVAMRIDDRWVRLGAASTGVKSRTTLPAFQSTVPGDYLLRIKGNGTGTRYVWVSVS